MYWRPGARLAADGYTVVVPLRGRRPIDDAFGAHPEGTRVLLGSDAGALRAWSLALAHPSVVDALVLAGLPLGPAPPPAADHRAELDLRNSCPTHRRLLANDPSFVWGRLAEHMDVPPSALPAVPVLLLHGAADRIAPLAPVQELARGSEAATLAVVEGGVHDVLNDRFDRSVAAWLVTFLEEVGKGAVIRDDGSVG